MISYPSLDRSALLQVLISCVVFMFNIAQLTRAEIVFVRPISRSIPTEASPCCRSVLSRNITECDSSITVWNSAFENYIPGLDITCAATCRDALVKYISDIKMQCAPGLILVTPEEWGLSDLAERALYNFDVTCIRSSSGRYCSVELQNLFGATEPIETNPLCSECYIKIYQTRLNSKWGYSERQKTAYSCLLSSCSIPAPSYPITYAPPQTATVATTTCTGSTTASAVVTGITRPVPARCKTANATYTIREGDTCNSIAEGNSVANAQLESINNLDPQCRGLVPGSKLCLPPPCKTHLITTNETCDSIIKMAGYRISLHRFLSWNGALNNDCTNIDDFVGKYICITPPGATAIPEPNPTRPQNTLVPVPSNAEPQSKKNCAIWYVIRGGETCAKLAINYGIRLQDFFFLNPNVTSGCTNLMRDVAYCVRPVGSLYAYEGYKPFTGDVLMTETLDLNHTKTRYNYTNIYKFITTTGWASATNIPQEPGPDPNQIRSYALCPEWTDLPFDTDEWRDGELPPEAFENEQWMEEFQRVCEPDWSKPLPTDPPNFPPLYTELPTTTTTTIAEALTGSGTESITSTTNTGSTMTSVID